MPLATNGSVPEQAPAATTINPSGEETRTQSPQIVTTSSSTERPASNEAGAAIEGLASLESSRTPKDIPSSLGSEHLGELDDKDPAGGPSHFPRAAHADRVNRDSDDMVIDPSLRNAVIDPSLPNVLINPSFRNTPASTTTTMIHSAPSSTPNADHSSTSVGSDVEMRDAPSSASDDGEVSRSEPDIPMREESNSQESQSERGGQSIAQDLMMQLGVDQYSDDTRSGTKWGQVQSASEKVSRRSIDTTEGKKSVRDAKRKSKAGEVSTRSLRSTK